MKDWWQKELEYEDRYRRGMVSGDKWKLLRYIPAAKQAFIDDLLIDSDGYWIYLADGYTAYDGGEDCGTIHEYTISDVKEAVKTIRRKV